MITAKNQTVRIIPGENSIGATVSDFWVGKTGRLRAWEGDNWYTVECEGKEILLRESEFVIIRQESS